MDLQGATQKKEAWYGTDFNIETLPDEWQTSWQSSAAREELHLPKPNPFIPTDFSMLPARLPTFTFKILNFSSEREI